MAAKRLFSVNIALYSVQRVLNAGLIVMLLLLVCFGFIYRTRKKTEKSKLHFCYSTGSY